MGKTPIRLSAYADSEMEVRSAAIDDFDSPEVVAALRAYDWRRGVVLVTSENAAEVAAGLTELSNICDEAIDHADAEERRALRYASQGLATAAWKASTLAPR